MTPHSQVPSEPARRLALVTGASSGIGEAFARAYAARDCDLALVARRGDRLEALARELAAAHGIEAWPIIADLSHDEAHLPIMAALRSLGRAPDILVNNAGFGIPRRFEDAPWSRQRAFLMTLAVAPCALAHALLPPMKARNWGRVINVASMAGFAPGVAGNTLYPGVKSLMIRFSQALDSEYRAHGIKVTVLCPGTTQSSFADQAGYAHLVSGSGLLNRAQSASHVVAVALRANEAGRVVVVPGWRNTLAVGLLRVLPETFTRRLVDRFGARYLLGEER